MKWPYARLWALLAVAFAVMLLLSTFDDLKIFGYPIAKLEISPREPVQAAAEKSAPSPKHDATPIDTTSKTILFVGDSMLEGLSPRFAAYAHANGHRLYTVIWYGSTTERWGKSHRLREYADRFKADYVVVCLGGNELFIRDVERTRADKVDAIIADIGELPYVWIGPPNWKPDTGINRLIASKVGAGRFFLSANLRLARASDGAHPTHEAALQWMDSVAHWIATESCCPIRLNAPERPTAKADRTIVLTPND